MKYLENVYFPDFEKLLLVGMLVIPLFFVGCERARDMVADTPIDTPTDMEMKSASVKIISLISLPENGKEAYIDWTNTILETLLSPEELVEAKLYKNVVPDQHPHLYSEFTFSDFFDAATYLNRPEIAMILQDQLNYMSDLSIHTFVERSDYDKQEAGDWKIIAVTLIDFPFSGKQAYLDWVVPNASITIEQPEVKTISTYDNYYGVSPQRLTIIEFASSADAVAWNDLEVTRTFDAELKSHTASKVHYVFELIQEELTNESF